MVEEMKIMAASFQRSHARTATLSVPDPAAGHHRPTPKTPAKDSWTFTAKSGSVSCGGHCSFLLGPGVHKVLFVPSKSLFPQSCVSSMTGLMVTSSRRLKPYPGLLHPEPLLLWQITADSYLCSGHSNTQRPVWLSLCGVSWYAQGFV